MMGWTPRTASMCQSGVFEHHLREASVSEVSIIGLDISKHVFHAHGADGRGRAMFSKRISRGKLLNFFVTQPSCTVALEACGGAHHWARQLAQLGHEVRLIPPAYVKPFVRRQKNDAIDAEAICEAAQRPSMRFVAVKSQEQQAAGLVFRTRDLLVRQRTQLINAIRGHLTEYGWVAPKGPSHVTMLADLRGDIQNGRTHAQAPTHHRQQRRRASGEQTRRPKGFVARTDAGSQTAHAGDRRARQQDGADHLGATCKEGKLQSSGRSQGVSLADLRSSQV